jgi:HD superfamily phosphohydrolase
VGKDFKRVYDELYGFIRLSGPVLEIVDTPVFQRLRRIRQLSAAYLVYPGATHTRFSHSLGTMHLMSRAAGILVSRGLIGKDEEEVLKIAALLHDVGHPPMSHTLELYYRRTGWRLSHEELGAMVIENDPVLRERIKYHGYSPSEIAGIIRGIHSSPLYASLLSSDVDVDRMDYLLRDSRHTGIVYGLIDAERILSMLLVDYRSRAGYEYKAVQALENFYLARLHMYQAVYYHKTITGYELLIAELYARILEEGGLRNKLSPEGLASMIRRGEYAYWDDCWLLDYARRIVLGEEDVSHEARILAKALLERRGLNLIADFSHPAWGEDEEKEAEERIKRIVEEEDGIVLSVVESIPVIRMEQAPLIRMPSGSWRSVAEVSGIVGRMPHSFIVARAYRVEPSEREGA